MVFFCNGRFYICTTEDMPGSGLGSRVSGTITEKQLGKRMNSDMGTGLLIVISILCSIIPIYYFFYCTIDYYLGQA